MSINETVLYAFEQAERPLNRQEMADRLGLTLPQVSTAINHLAGKHKIHPAPGEEKKSQNRRYVAEYHYGVAASRMNNVMQSPVWVPPKPLHRPVIHAPGCVVREFITNRVLA